MIEAKNVLTGEVNVATQYVLPDLEELEVKSNELQQVITPSKDGFSKVTVNPISLQDKTINVKGNQNIYVHPDENFDALAFVNVIATVDTETKEVTPTKEVQTINRSEGKYIDSVTVNPIPDNYIEPSGELEITQNGNYDVTDKASVKVATSGVDINEYFNLDKETITDSNTRLWIKNNYFLKFPNIVIPDNVTSLAYFCTCSAGGNIGFPFSIVPKIIGGKNVTSMAYMYFRCEATEIDVSDLTTNNLKNAQSMFDTCSNITSLDIGHFDFSKVTQINNIFSWNSKLENLIFAQNFGKGFTQKQANFGNYTLTLSGVNKLSHDSLMDVINKLYDLNLTYDVANGGTLYTQKLVLGSTNLAKLTEEEKAIATNKGWVLS